MKNLPPWTVQALRLRRAGLARRGVGEALSPFSPVGWVGAVAQAGGETKCFCGGEAVRGDQPIAVTEDTIFRVASISKLIGAAAACTLVRAGELALDATVREVLGIGTPKPVTLLQLLTHTAGLDDAPAYDAAIVQTPLPSLDEVLARSFIAAPGTRFHYSNLGAGVAGMMVEAAAGMPFDDYVRKAIFVPLGIDASFHPQRIARRARMANCYRVPGKALAYDAHSIARQPLDESVSPLRHYSIPAGKLMISAPDLLRVLRGLPQRLPEMFVLQDGTGRGLGVAIAPKGVLHRQRILWGHQGVAYGALCEAWVDPGDGAAAVLLTNGARLSRIGPLQRAGQSGIAALLDL